MSLFKSIKKIISSSILVLILFGLFTPFLSFAQNQNTATPTASNEKYYYYPLLDQKSFSNKDTCNKEYTNYVNSLLSTLSLQKLFDENDESKRAICFNDSNNANNFFYYKPGSKSSAKFQDEKSCEDSSKKDRESKYKTVIDAWNNYFGTTLGKTISITDLPSLWSCTLVDQTKISAEEKAKIETNYYPLALLPGLGEECTPDSTGNTICIKVASDCHQDPNNPKEQICTPGLGFAGYLNIMINLIIGICAVLAMIMIVMGGIQYMTSELVSSKQAAKESITNAILGLLLALGAFALLNTINPNLLDIGLGNLPTATVTMPGGDEMATSFTPLSDDILKNHGIYCPGTGGKSELPKIAKSFERKVTYSQEKRSTATNNTIYLDCSSYAKQVYKCAGLDLKGYNTASMFPGTETITSINGNTINGNYQLQPGDVLGWMNGETSKYKGGHVVVYYNTGNQIETHGPSDILNKAIDERSIEYYGDALKHIIKASGSTAGSTQSTEKATDIMYNFTNKTLDVTIEKFSTVAHKIKLFNGKQRIYDQPLTYTKLAPNGTAGLFISPTLTTEQYVYLKGKSITANIYDNKGKGIGILSLNLK